MTSKAYAIYERSEPVDRNNSFTIIGFVRNRIRSEKYTRLSIESVGFNKMTPVKDVYQIYFTGNIKTFVDKYVYNDYLVDVTGQVVVSSKSTEKQQILILEGKHVLAFKNFINVYEHPKNKYVHPDTLSNNKDLAF